MKRRISRQERGSALMVAMAVSAILLLIIAGLFGYVQAERTRAGRPARELTRKECAEAGLLLARAYFSANVSTWNKYLNDPSHLNPVPASWNTSPADPVAAVAAGAAAWTGASAPFNDLFYDLDGDGKKDVYIYVRDNQDELLPAANNWRKDNDQNVIVGAICISTTLSPRLTSGATDPSELSIESLLSYNAPSNTYASQANGGSSNNGNHN